jgi:hypothetical protein
MEKPTVIIANFEGLNNTPAKYERYREMGHYRPLNTVWVTPTRGVVPAEVIPSWMGLIGGFNAALVKIFSCRQEVGHAYNNAILQVLSNEVLSKFPYILTVEEDNTPPPDGLIKLLESIQEYDGVSGLYWCKGEDAVPHIWGDPAQPFTYAPQKVIPNTLQKCNGISMGFSLYRTEMFKNPGFEFGNWFKTVSSKEGAMTQDLYFCKRAAELGYKFAVDTRVKVGHLDVSTGIIW